MTFLTYVLIKSRESDHNYDGLIKQRIFATDEVSACKKAVNAVADILYASYLPLKVSCSVFQEKESWSFDIKTGTVCRIDGRLILDPELIYHCHGANNPAVEFSDERFEFFKSEKERTQ